VANCSKKIIVKIKMHSSITKMTRALAESQLNNGKSLYMYPKVPPSVAVAILQVLNGWNS